MKGTGIPEQQNKQARTVAGIALVPVVFKITSFIISGSVSDAIKKIYMLSKRIAVLYNQNLIAQR